MTDSLNTLKNHFNVHRQTNGVMFLVFQPQVHWNKSYLWRIKFVKTERMRRYLHSMRGSSSKSRPVVVLLRQGSVFNLEGFVHFPAGLQLDNCSGEKWLTDRVGGKNLQRPFVPAFKPVSLTVITFVEASALFLQRQPSRKEHEPGPESVRNQSVKGKK